MHAALAGRAADPDPAAAVPGSDAFEAEPVTDDDLRSWRAQASAEARTSLAMLRNTSLLHESAQTAATAVLGAEAKLLRLIEERAASGAGMIKCRTHGDYHLAQVLLQRDDFILIDFEGEPARPLAERRRKTSPLRDVAGMLRSFSYARHHAEVTCRRESADCAAYAPLLADWERETRAAFLEGYADAAGRSGLQAPLRELQTVLDLFEIEKAFYELRYELDNRPDWAVIPLDALRRFADAS